MSENGPHRLIDIEAGADPFVREVLEAGRSEIPTEEQLIALAACLDLPFGPAGGGDGGGGSPGGEGAPDGGALDGGGSSGGLASSAGGGAKLVIALAASAVVVGSGLALWQTTTGPKTVEADRSERAADVGPTTWDEPTSSESLTLSRDASLPEARIDEPLPEKRGPRVAEASKAPAPSEEIALLQRAQDSLRSSPSRSLALVHEHGQSFPRSMLIQEREVIAVEALMRMGRTTAARLRAERFHRRWPSSSHCERIDRLVGRTGSKVSTNE